MGYKIYLRIVAFDAQKNIAKVGLILLLPFHSQEK